MALNLSTLLPAKINTSEIATKYDVSSSIAAYNPANYINANTTTIDGGKITTGSIDANRITASTSLGSPNIYGGNISGTNITGVNIVGSVIKSSWIDYSSTGSLTNWKAATIADMSNTGSIYYAYRNNFAKDNATGNWVTTDSPTNYVRLPATTSLYSTPNTVSFASIAPVGWYPSLTVYPTLTSGVFLSNSYAQSSINRMIKNIGETASMNLQTEGLILSGYGTRTNAKEYSYLTFSLNGITYTLNSSVSFSSSNGLSYSIPQGASGNASLSWNGFNFRIYSDWQDSDYTSDGYLTKVFLKAGNHSFVVADSSVFFGSFSMLAGYSRYQIYARNVQDYVAMPLFQVY
jgi:hypothetical protein